MAVSCKGQLITWCGEVSTTKSEISCATSCAIEAPATDQPNETPHERKAAPMKTPSHLEYKGGVGHSSGHGKGTDHFLNCDTFQSKGVCAGGV